MSRVQFKGGPRDGQEGETTVNPVVGLPGPIGCVTEAHAAGMHGVYQANRNIRQEPFQMVWRNVRRGDDRACQCGCGGRV